ncbi:MAG: amino acid adenylation domain-containing protein [Myxococcota bacterium]|nr:amino acid adenylation domain-containing protein [Myxococcota bacterium]
MDDKGRTGAGAKAALTVEEKRRLVEQLLRERARSQAAGDRIPRRQDPEVPAPLSHVQEQLWVTNQLARGSSQYTVATGLRLRGELDPEALGRALTAVIQRHEVLRCRILPMAGKPMQVAVPTAGVPLPLDDLRAVPEERRRAEAERLSAEHAAAPFDLASEAPFRARLIRIANDHHLLLVAMPHEVTDNWSINLLGRDLSALYTAEVTGQGAALPELKVQYADYAVWQRKRLTEERLQAQLDYWRATLGGAVPPLSLPVDRPRPSGYRHRAQRATFRLDAGQVRRLTALAREQKGTRFHAVIAVYQALLHRFSGQEVICVGTTGANRPSPELDPVIGFFANTYVLRADFEPGTTFRQLVDQARERNLQALENQDVPFARIVEALQPERNSVHAPVFQTMITLQQAPPTSLEFGGLEASPYNRHNGEIGIDLAFTFDEDDGDGSLTGVVDYSADLFDAATIDQLVASFQRLVDSVLAAPDRPIAAAALLAPARQEEIETAWRAQAESTPPTVLEALADWAKREPGRIAARLGEEVLGYGELEARTHRLAHALRRRGIRPGDRVGLYVPRSLEWLIGVIAVWKAGGAAVPLDVKLPRERVLDILRATEARVLLSTSDRQGSAHPEMELLPLDDEGAWGLPPGEYPPVEPRPDLDQPAYILFTSGSSGQPKGVVVPHRGLFGLGQAWRSCGVTEETVALQFSSPSFDVSIGELCIALPNGASLCIAPEELSGGGEPLAAYLRRYRVSMIALGPAVIATLDPATLPDLRTVVSGGEQLPPELVARFVPRCRFFNAYGPTEATNTTTLGECLGQDAVPPIGVAIPGVAARVLDAHLQPVPPGVVGELYVGGDGVALGYLDDPAQTAERFLPDPWLPGRRMYRTGDLVREGRDGRIRFVGRRDNQVKIRGFRIELEEIEAELLRQPGVAEAAVTVFEQAGVGKRLCAYVLPVAGAPVDFEALRASLGARLPDYMVPTAYQRVERWPITLTMKIDRRALPPPQPAHHPERTPAQAPVGRFELLVAEAWRELLGVEAPSRRDDFFLVGGHSLLATQLVARLQEAVGVELDLRIVFEHPILEALAAEVARLSAAAPGERLPPVTPVDRAAPLALSFAQQRLWFLDRLEPDSAAYVLPGAIRLVGALDVSALERALGAVIQRHESLRTVFISTGLEARQVVRPATAYSLPVEELGSLGDADREGQLLRRCREEAHRPFDLEAGPLFRALLLSAGPSDHVLMLSMHHIVSDGWSVGLLMADLVRAYQSASSGSPPALCPVNLQYADFAAWQTRHLDAVLDRQLAYWKERLTGAPDALALPTDRPRGALQSDRGHHVPVRFSRQLREALARTAQEEGATLFMTVLACFKVLLSWYSGQEDVSVGTSVAGRNRPETEGIVGFFVNTLVLRTELDGARTFREVLRRVRQTTLDALAHQDAPFERVVEAVKPVRDLSRTPLFQVMFDMQATPAPLTFPGCEVRPFDFDTDTAKFDLTLGLEDSPAGLDGYVEFAADLFDRATVLRMMAHLERLMEHATGNPDAPMWTLGKLSQQEEHALLVEYNQSAADRPLQPCYTQRFEAQAAQTPERVAVRLGSEVLRYGELNAMANGVAHRLIELGVGQEQVVALLDDRSPRLLAVMLGVLKAGAAILQLDPYQPAKRVAQVLGQSRTRVVIGSQPYRPVLEEALTLLPDEVRPGLLSLEAQVSAPRPEDPAPRALPDNLCYLIFTSGSTGQPKGAMLDHRGMLNHLWAEIDQLGLGEDDVIAQTASQCFDISVWQFLVALMLGGRTEIVSDEVVRDPPRLLSELDARGVTLFEPVPSLYRPVLEEAARQGASRPALSRLRWTMLCGEAIPADLCRDSFALYPHVSLLNAYGPAECSDDVTQHLMRSPPEGGFTPLGRPIHNMQAYVLDAHLRPVPYGAAGELVLAGVGVGRGYYDDPVRTAQAFIPNPFSREGGTRMYRTGDMARFHPDGRLEFLGRVDHQVKVNGHRIELGDVEAALGDHPSVGQVVAVARVDASGQKRLVVYLTLRPGAPAEATALRLHVQGRLPVYMIPSRFVVLDELPLSANGKVDRKRLPDPDAQGREAAFVEPRTEMERRLASLWREVLAVEVPIGLDDNFFNLGGHSMLAVRMLNRAREDLGREVPLRAVFEAQTLAALAARFEAPPSGEEALGGLLVSLQPAGALPPLYCIHPGFGGTMAYQALATLLGPKQPVFGLTAPELEGLPTPSSLEERVELYAATIRAHRPGGPYRLAGYSDGALLAYELARRLESEGQRVELVALIDRPTPALASAVGGSGTLPARPTALERLSEALGLMEDPTFAGLMDDEARWEHILAQGRRFGMLPAEASLEALDPIIASLSSMQDHLTGWRPGPYAGEVMVVSSQFSLDRLKDPALGWGAALGRAVQGVTIPGAHDTIVQLPHVRALALALQDSLAKGAAADR